MNVRESLDKMDEILAARTASQEANMVGAPRVVPAILTDNPDSLRTMVRLVETFADYTQIDIMDGRFVPSRSITAADVAASSPKFKWEAHLMVEQPEKYLAGFKRAGASRVIFHYEASPSPRQVVTEARRLGFEIGMAVNPETPVTNIQPLLSLLDSVLFLSVHPGFYGAKFIPEVMDKIRALREISSIETSIDGGIKESNIVTIARTGVDTICVGSAIFLQPDPAASYHHLQDLVNQTTSSRQS